MATNFPGSLDNSTSLPYPTSTSDTNNPSLAGGQDNQNDAVIAAQTKLGINASTASTNSVLLGVGSGQSQWGSITGAYTAGSTGTGNFVLASSPTIVSPTLTTPIINNPTLKTDSMIGFTSADSGTLYGISVSSSEITTEQSVAGAAIVNNSITNTQLASNAVLSGNLGLSSSYSGGVFSYVNGGTAGGTFYYINLGGMKLLWGATTSLSDSSTFQVNFPNTFFNSIQNINLTNVGSAGNVVTSYIVTGSVNADNFQLYNNANSGSALPIYVWVIGT